jgi:hypothetical protein
MDTNEAIRQIQDITRRVEPSDRSKCVAGALVEAFDWSRSEQGSDYWDNIHNTTLNNMFSDNDQNHLYSDRARGYELIVRPGPKPRFIAGCRFFTLEQALEHWGPGSLSPQPKYIEAIEAWVAKQEATVKAVDQDTAAPVG